MKIQPKKKKKKAYHHGDLRETLIRVTLELIESTHSTSFSIRDISKRAGVSHAAAYRHFKGRNQILLAVAERGFKIFGEYLKAATTQNAGDPLAGLRAQSEAYLRFALEHPTHFQLMFSNENVGPLDESFLQVSLGSFNEMQSLAEQLIASGTFRKMPLDHATTAIWSSIHGLSCLVVNGQLGPVGSKPSDVARLARDLSENLLLGLCARD